MYDKDSHLYVMVLIDADLDGYIVGSCPNSPEVVLTVTDIHQVCRLRQGFRGRTTSSRQVECCCKVMFK